MKTALAIVGTAAVSTSLHSLIPEGQLISLVALVMGTVALTVSILLLEVNK
jgi:hypothetical protein